MSPHVQRHYNPLRGQPASKMPADDLRINMLYCRGFYSSLPERVCDGWDYDLCDGTSSLSLYVLLKLPRERTPRVLVLHCAGSAYSRTVQGVQAPKNIRIKQKTSGRQALLQPSHVGLNTSVIFHTIAACYIYVCMG